MTKIFRLTLVLVIWVCGSLALKAQLKALTEKIDLRLYSNKAQGYSILSAQYSFDAYKFSKHCFFSSSEEFIKENSDSAIANAQLAIQYADSAFDVADDTCQYAKDRLQQSKDFQLAAIEKYEYMAGETSSSKLHKLSEAAMYDMSNAAVDAYDASMFFGPWEVDSSALRDITRLESDENSFMAIKDLYDDRLKQIDDELAKLEELKKTATGAELDRINEEIAALKAEKSEIEGKINDSQGKLNNVRNDLNEGMIGVMGKSVFTTEKYNYYSKDVPIPDISNMPKGLVYMVQIGYLSKRLPESFFNGIFPLAAERQDGRFRYMAGMFKSYEDAKSAISKVQGKGCSDAFVVSYLNRKRIPVGEALQLEQGKK